MKKMTDGSSDTGNGAREALIQFSKIHENHGMEEQQADYLLAWLWVEGYKIVPV